MDLVVSFEQSNAPRHSLIWLSHEDSPFSGKWQWHELSGVKGVKNDQVALADRGVAGTATVTLTRLGYQVDNVEDPEEGARALEQGLYSLVVASRSGAAGARGENLYQRINRLSPENRRRLVLILVGDDYKSGDGLQAWTMVSAPQVRDGLPLDLGLGTAPVIYAAERP